MVYGNLSKKNPFHFWIMNFLIYYNPKVKVTDSCLIHLVLLYNKVKKEAPNSGIDKIF